MFDGWACERWFGGASAPDSVEFFAVVPAAVAAVVAGAVAVGLCSVLCAPPVFSSPLCEVKHLFIPRACPSDEIGVV